LAAGICYFAAAKLGGVLAFPAAPVSALWAPNAILMAALLLTSRERWPAYLLAVLPFHLLAQLPGLPIAQVIIQYIANTSLALLGALALTLFCPQPHRFNQVRTTFTLVLFGGLLAPAITSVFMASAFAFAGISREFWLTVVARTVTNTFAVVALVPLIVHIAVGLRTRRNPPPLSRTLEAVTLGGLLVGVCVLVFAMPDDSPQRAPTLLYAPLPLLAWAAMRFGVPGACGASLLVGAVSTLGMLNGFGPFFGDNPVENALSVVTFHVVMCITFVAFAALLEEWRFAGRALSISKARFRSIFENNLIPTAIWHDDLRISEANEAFVRLTGVSGADIAGGKLRFNDLGGGGKSNPERLAEADIIAAFASSERELALGDGRRVSVLLSHCRFPTDEGGVLYALDLSASRRAEARTEQAENLHSAVLASLHDQIAVLDNAGTVIEINESWRRAVEGAHPSRIDRVVAGDNFIEKCARAAEGGDRSAAEQLRALRAVLDGSQIRCQLESREIDGEAQFCVEVSFERLRRLEGGAVVTRTDVTARKLAEQEARNQRQQLTHLSRAAVLGQLSGAFAHELNQPLTSILGNAEAALSMLANGTDNSAELGEILRDIVQDDERAAQVIQRLRALLGKGDSVRSPVDLNATVRDSLALVHSEIISRNVRVDIDLDLEAPLVLGDRVQLQQVVLNLLMNACEAMTAAPVPARKAVLATRYLPLDAAVEITVRDHGGGIPPGDLERIFQPFVTSKTHGLGLGLAICRSVAESHHGRLWADNVAAGGAIFHLKVPLDGGPP
jgi:signal transduction histidine kinase/integral membrane sensor domain MASE1